MCARPPWSGSSRFWALQSVFQIWKKEWVGFLSWKVFSWFGLRGVTNAGLLVEPLNPLEAFILGGIL